MKKSTYYLIPMVMFLIASILTIKINITVAIIMFGLGIFCYGTSSQYKKYEKVNEIDKFPNQSINK
jgi:hypothetical protein